MTRRKLPHRCPCRTCAKLNWPCAGAGRNVVSCCGWRKRERAKKAK